MTIQTEQPISRSRHTSPEPVKCDHPECGWSGIRMNAYHGYAPVYPDDVEPMDYCPVCWSNGRRTEV